MKTGNNKQPRKKSKVTEKATRLSLKVIFGDFISSEFFNRYKFTILVSIVLLMFYIAFNYECKTHMERINVLEEELAKTKSESVRARSAYRSRTRESVMRQRIDSIGLDLALQSQPPFVLYYRNGNSGGEE